MLDYIKDMGFHYSTIAAITISISDMEIPEKKQEMIAASEKLVDKYEKAYSRGHRVQPGKIRKGNPDLGQDD